MNGIALFTYLLFGSCILMYFKSSQCYKTSVLVNNGASHVFVVMRRSITGVASLFTNVGDVSN